MSKVVMWNTFNGDLVLNTDLPEKAEDSYPKPKHLASSSTMAAVTFLYPHILNLKKEGRSTVITEARIKEYFSRVSRSKRTSIEQVRMFVNAANCFFYHRSVPSPKWSFKNTIENDLKVILNILQSTPDDKSNPGFDMDLFCPVTLSEFGMFKNLKTITERYECASKNLYLGDPFIIVKDEKNVTHIKAWTKLYSKEFEQSHNSAKFWLNAIKIARSYQVYNKPVSKEDVIKDGKPKKETKKEVQQMKMKPSEPEKVDDPELAMIDSIIESEYAIQ